MVNKGLLPLSCGGGAALISVIIGFISGVSPGVLLFRGLLSALAAAVFVLLSGWLVDNYLPELSSLNTGYGPAGDDAAASPGSRVNIVMSDDGSDGEAGSDDSIGSGTASPPGTAGPDDIEIAETAGSVHNNKPYDPEYDPLDSEGLDTLPNLDSLEISMGGGGASEYEGTESFESEEPVSNINVSGGLADSGKRSLHGDPEDIAKAVKTVLARDK